jgi:transcription antitermination factor NusG
VAGALVPRHHSFDHGRRRHAARVPDTVIDGLRASERDGLIELPKPPRFQRGDKVRVTSGAFIDRLAVFDGQTAHQRVAVLLRLLGGERRIELPEDGIEAAG